MNTLGITLPLADQPWTAVLERLDDVAGAGFDAIWVRDAPLADAVTGDTGSGHDPVALLGAAMGRRLPIAEYGTAVLCPGFHKLPTLGRQLASLQHLSSGRLVIGLGSGMREPVNRAYGLEPKQRRDAVIEAARVLPALLRGEDAGLPDDVVFYRPPGLTAPPVMLASSDPELFAAAGPAVTGWLTMIKTPERVRETGERLSAAAGRALDCAMQVSLLPDLDDARSAPRFQATGSAPALAIGAELLPGLLRGYLAAGVGRFIVHLPVDEPSWPRLRAIGRAWRQARGFAAPATPVPTVVP
jgi:alkanesulfonate monooxygenase SsuD/methylene tetrahydromethanopterin reductase-like flavin-dependent oxidoreductase (luciferase family)